MKKGYLATLILSTLAVTQPLWGGTSYIPLAKDIKVDGNRFITEVRFQNDSGGAASVRYLFIPAQKDGTAYDRETEMTELVVPPRGTLKVDDIVPRGRRGMVEVSADEEVSITARLIGESPNGATTLGVDLPVVTSRNAVSAGRTTVLPGLSRVDGMVVSDFFLLNLSVKRSQCAVEVFKRGGTPVTDQTISVPPLSVFPYDDVLALLGLLDVADTSIAVTCDELSHPFATVHKLDTAELLYIAPAGGGSSTLDPFPANNCPDDALINLEGTVHVATQNNARKLIFADTTPGAVYSRLSLTMEFTHGGWHQRSGDNHNVFWLNRTEQWRSNVFGYLNLWGPNRNFAKLTTNVSLPATVLQTVQKGAIFQEGVTYSVSYVYDTATNFIEAVISVKGGEEVVRLQDKPTVKKIVADDRFMVGLGHGTQEHGPEVAGIGWTFSNLCVTLE